MEIFNITELQYFTLNGNFMLRNKITSGGRKPLFWRLSTLDCIASFCIIFCLVFLSRSSFAAYFLRRFFYQFRRLVFFTSAHNGNLSHVSVYFPDGQTSFSLHDDAFSRIYFSGATIRSDSIKYGIGWQVCAFWIHKRFAFVRSDDPPLILLAATPCEEQDVDRRSQFMLKCEDLKKALRVPVQGLEKNRNKKDTHMDNDYIFGNTKAVNKYFVNTHTHT